MSDREVINRLIRKAARERLAPLGLQQKGRSRLWFEDRGWSLIVVEFQPGAGPGTYLNVGAMWLWAERAYWAFDEGYRVYWCESDGSSTRNPMLDERVWVQHARFLNADQFAQDIALVATAAAEQAVKLRRQFAGPAAVAEHVTSTDPGPDETPEWRAFHGGVAAAMSGDAATAERLLEEVMSVEVIEQWQHSLAAQAATVRSLLGQPQELRTQLQEVIHSSRKLLKLPKADLSLAALGA